MAPNQSEPRRGIVERELSYRVINAFFEVYNSLGPGFLESLYARSLEIALAKRGISVEREVNIDVFFEGHPVGRHRLDMLVEGRVILELKSTEVLPRMALRQTRSYLAAANLDLALILHFGPEAHFHRVLGRRHAPSMRRNSAVM